MARPRKENADYFSHDSGMRDDPKIKAVRNKYGFKGYAVWCYLLEVLTNADHFQIEWDDMQRELLAADFGLEGGGEELGEMVEYFRRLKLFRLDENGILRCVNLEKRLDGVVQDRKRKREWIEKRLKDTPEKLLNSNVSEVLDGNNEVLDRNNGVLDVKNHTKESKVKESKYNPIGLSKEEVANATSKKRAAKKGKGERGEDPKSKNAPKTPTEASTETLEGGVDRLYPEDEKTSQNANLGASPKSNPHTPETAPADQAPQPVSNRVRKEDEEEIPPTPPKEEEEEKKQRENVVANATTSKSGERSDETDEEAETKILYKHIIEAWNEETGGALGKLMMITGRRREMVRARIRETSVEDFFTMIHNAASSSFLRGESQRGWVANFDWCIKPNNYPKVLEGRYNDHEGEGVILPPNAKRVTDSSEGVDYRYIDFRELDKQHRR